MSRLKEVEDYAQLLNDLKARIQAVRTLAVNRELIALYWDMGKMIVERQQKHGWGNAVIDSLSQDLRREFPDNKEFSRSNLFYMRQFYLTYKDTDEFVQQLVGQIPWGHNIVIWEKVKDLKAREYYLQACIENGWSRNVLVHQIETDAYARHALTAKTTTYLTTLPAPLGEQAEEMLKDPYMFTSFSSLLRKPLRLRHVGAIGKGEGGGAGITGATARLPAGTWKGLCVPGQSIPHRGGRRRVFHQPARSNRRLAHSLGLRLFFHRGLRCLVAIELKTGDFKPEYAGKMHFYLNALDDLVRLPAENPSIGIILCKGKNKVVAEYALRGMTKPIGVAEYRLTQQLPQELQNQLPSVTELEQQLQDE